MKLLVSSAVAAAAALAAFAVGSVRAADLPLKEPPPPPPAYYGWTGFYLGGDVGVRGALTDAHTDAFSFGGVPPLVLTNTADSQPLNSTAFRFGGYLGYNWQFARTWVAGLEGDVGSADKTVTLNGVFLPGPFLLMPGDPSASLSTRTSWDASLRARIGYLVTPWTLLYATGGPAWLRVGSTATCSTIICGAAPVISFSNASTLLGWTVGAGIETRLWGNWFGRAEYRYSDYGDVSYNNNGAFGITATYDERVRTQTGLFGLAYKFGDVPADPGAWAPVVSPAAVFPTKAPPPADPGTWSGAYAGADFGMRATVTNATENSVTINGAPAPCAFAVLIPPVACVGSDPMGNQAFRIGGHLGYDWQFAPIWIAGAEGDFGWADRTATLAGTPLPGSLNGFLIPIGGFSGLAGDSFSVRTTWDASVRGRVGILVGPSVMLYATGGPAWLSFQSTSTCALAPAGGCFMPVSPMSITNTTTRTGYTVGAGGESRLWSNWFVRGEYRFADYGTTSYVNTVLVSPGGGVGPFVYKDTYSLRMQTNTVTLGFSYKFWDVRG
jgi:outer membrane immunogenic protein